MFYSITALAKTSNETAILVTYHVNEVQGDGVIILQGQVTIAADPSLTPAQHKAAADAAIVAICKTELDRRARRDKADAVIALGAPLLPITGTVT